MFDHLIDSDLNLVEKILLENYLETIDDISILQSGSPNQCWYIKSDSHHYMFRKCVRNNNKEWLNYQEEIVRSLKEKNIPVNTAIPSNKGEYTIGVNGYCWQLRPYLEGRHFEIGSDSDENEAISLLCELHKIIDLPRGISNPNIGIEHWIKSPDECIKETTKALNRCFNRKTHMNRVKTLTKYTEDALSMLNFKSYSLLPVTCTHGDFHCTNLIYNGSSIGALLDFDTMEFRPRIYDVAVAAFMLTRKKRGSFELNGQKTKNFFDKYKSIISLNEIELKSIIPILILHFMPNARYIDLMRTEAPNKLIWYLDWTMQALESVNRQSDIITYSSVL